MIRVAVACCLIVVGYLWHGLVEPKSPQGAFFTISSIGLPAITSEAPSLDPLVPSFTIKDAKAYALAHPPKRSIINITASSITFLTAREMAARKVPTVGSEPERLICAVRLNGLFKTFVSGLPGFEVVTKHVYVYFDAHTGNYLGDWMV